MDISFTNTEIAFSGKTDDELRRAFRMFALMGSRWMVKAGGIAAKVGIPLGLPLKNVVKKTVYHHFCGGESLPECTPAVRRLSQYGIKTIPDFSVEGREREEDFELTLNETLSIVEYSKNEPDIPFAVFKLTGMARFELLEKTSAGELLTDVEKEEFERVKKRVEKICKACAAAGKKLLIDAEETWIQNTIDLLVTEMMKKYNKKEAVVFNTIQMYRKDRLAFLKNSFADAQREHYFLGIKPVRGAYMEKERKRAKKMDYPSPIQDTKEETDCDYDLAVEFCLSHIDQIALFAGTHNEHSCMLLASGMEKRNIKRNHPHVWFSQLFGMSDHISYNLAKGGFNVAKYLPYGPIKMVLPYLIRRAEENTAISGQMGRELSLIVKELERRKEMIR